MLPMTDITIQFNDLLSARGSSPVGASSRVRQLDKFLQEAHRINKHIQHLHNELRDIRQAYLATAQPLRRVLRSREYDATSHRHLTDREREEIDITAKRSIRELTASIQELEQAAELMRAADEAVIRKQRGNRLGALGAWASGGVGALSKTAEHVSAVDAARCTASHRESVVVYLRHHLEACCRTQQGMMEKRLTKEMEKNRSILARAGTLQPHQASIPTASASSVSHGPGTKVSRPSEHDAAAFAASQGLTAEQVQMFEKGNQEMMEQMETELVKIRSAQESLVEIAQLQNTLVSNLSLQKEQIDMLTEDQYAAEDNVRGGNKELARAAQKPSAARYTFFAASIISAFLVLWDLFV